MPGEPARLEWIPALPRLTAMAHSQATMDTPAHACHRSDLRRGMIIEAPAFITEEGRAVLLSEYLSDGGTFPADAVPKLWTVVLWDVEGGETQIVGHADTGPLVIDANVSDYPELFAVVGTDPDLTSPPDPSPLYLLPHVEISIDGIGYELNDGDKLALVALLRGESIAPPQRQSLEIWADILEGNAEDCEGCQAPVHVDEIVTNDEDERLCKACHANDAAP